MAILLIVFLYAVVLALLRPISALDMSNEVRLAFNVLGGIGALVLPIVFYSLIDFRLTKRAVTAVGQQWCLANAADFVAVEMHKNHFTLVYKQPEQKQRKKFRVRFVFTTWHVKKVEWLS
jgi:hypothetical protein